MTDEEAIELLRYYRCVFGVNRKTIDYAIKAIEDRTKLKEALDKIRAEIEEMKLDVDLDIGNEMIYNNAIKDVLEIIDKYRGDTE